MSPEISNCFISPHGCRKQLEGDWAGLHPAQAPARCIKCNSPPINSQWKDERLSRPGWRTYSGRFTHISGHPSAAGRAQDSESSPVKDRRSTHCATQPNIINIRLFGVQRLEWCSYPMVKKFEDMYNRFDRKPACDRDTDRRMTDRQIYYDGTIRAMHSIAR